MRLVGPRAPGDEAAPPVLPFGLEAGAFGETRPIPVEVVDRVLHAVIGLGDRGRGKRVGLDDVGAGQRIGQVDGFDGVGLRERQEVVVALQVTLAADETLPTEMALVKAETLDLRAHGAVEDEDAFAGRGPQCRSDTSSPSRVGCVSPNSISISWPMLTPANADMLI